MAYNQDAPTPQKIIDRFIDLTLNSYSADQLKVTGAKAISIINGDTSQVYVLKVPPNKIYMKFSSEKEILR